jgi:fluoride exporter
MSVAAWLAFLAGGAVGAPSRYLLDCHMQSKTHGSFPWGTFLINATGSLLLGVLTGLALEHGLSPTTETVLGTGFCGAFTTYSTFAFETVRLAERRASDALRNIAANVVVSTVAAGIGLAITLQ